MSYKTFIGKRYRHETVADAAMICISRGQIRLNRYAGMAMDAAKIDHVLVLWDTDDRKFALKAIREYDRNAYKIHYREYGDCMFSGANFLRAAGIYHLESTACLFDPTMDIFLEVQFPKVQTETDVPVKFRKFYYMPSAKVNVAKRA